MVDELEVNDLVPIRAVLVVLLLAQWKRKQEELSRCSNERTVSACRVPSEVPVSPAWMPMTCELPVKVEREA